MSSNVATVETTSSPPTKEFTAAWIAYFLFALAVFIWWPALLGLVVCYSKRSDPATGFIASHHSWLIRTFWYSLLAYLLCLALILFSVWPIVADILRQASAHGDWGSGGASIHIDWTSIFTTAGGAAAGGIGLTVVWIWFVYRVVRGMLTLGDARPLP